eukprot:SAG31_NODE_47632_length_231_cov_18.348485_1_plen_38_part_01
MPLPTVLYPTYLLPDALQWIPWAMLGICCYAAAKSEEL